jgi:hypothetical protein
MTSHPPAAPPAVLPASLDPDPVGPLAGLAQDQLDRAR